tara:strand:+ start:333 stop:1829 length:1497 start_codon:yes stop_codon:yes gene_type:complete
MAIYLNQTPLYKTSAAAQDWIFIAAEDSGIVVNETLVKFICRICVYDDIGNISPLVATLKTTPNAAGVGVFDIRPIIESFVNSDNLASNIDIGNGWGNTASAFKTVLAGAYHTVPIHLIDKFGVSPNSTKYVACYFNIEYLDATTNQIVEGLGQDFYNGGSIGLLAFNGTVYNTDTLTTGIGKSNYGYDLDSNNFILKDTNSKFLSNTPATQYARLTDYGTMAFFNGLQLANFSFDTAPNGSANSAGQVYKLEMKMYNSAGVQIGGTQNIFNETLTGGIDSGGSLAKSWTHLLFAGIFPGNLRGWSTTFQANLANLSYYTIEAFDDNGNQISQTYTISIICDSSFGYEGVRLAWLNKFGAWDYYTFNKKSVRSINTNKTNYTQLQGTWNEGSYRPYSYKGGQKTFRVNSKERIRLNTDYMIDVESVWIEELISSPEVYIIKDFDASYTPNAVVSVYNAFVEPVLVTTSSFTRKTKANDRLIQYTIEIEKNKNQSLQAI